MTTGLVIRHYAYIFVQRFDVMNGDTVDGAGAWGECAICGRSAECLPEGENGEDNSCFHIAVDA
jgi:hypothetical protein